MIKADLMIGSVFTFLFITVVAAMPVRAGPAPPIRTIVYHGIRADDPGGRCGLPNPERGFRVEAVIGEPPGSSIWSRGEFLRGKATKGYSDDWFLLNIRRYQVHGISLLQAYCYLTEFCDRPITPEKLAYLQASLTRCRQAGIKILLRFAYEKDTKRSKGPTADVILKHLDQLAPLIKNNSDIIYVLQAGFVGAWGEWHSSAHYLEENHAQLAQIIAKELAILPDQRMVQLRVLPRYKRWILEDPLFNTSPFLSADNAFSGVPVSRLGFADDGFLAEGSDGGTWPEPPYYANPGNPEFDWLTRESPYMAVDGELFWSDQGGAVDGLQAALRMRLHHYTSFSLTHAYSGFEEKRYSIDRWMETHLTEGELRQNNLPVPDGYFFDDDSTLLARTIFEYIRDQLGYRFELQKARFPQKISKNDTLHIDIDLINRGFATLINPRPVYLVLINTSGQLILNGLTGADPQTWQPVLPGDDAYQPLVHHIAGSLSPKTLQAGEYMIGLWLPDAAETIRNDARYAIRLANRDVPWWTTADGKFGVNILGTVTVID